MLAKRYEKHTLALASTVEALSDPAKETSLPLPYIGNGPKQFHLQNKASGLFTFRGRVIWKTLYNAAKNIDSRQNNRLHLHGTLGAGKSHMLAGLVCQLIKDGTTESLLDLELRQLKLCNLAAQLGKPIVFIIDQANALDIIHNRVSNDRKKDVPSLLGGI